MRRRLVIITEIISPYRIPLFNELAKHSEVDLHVIFLAETDPGLRQWQVYKEEIRFSYSILSSWRKRIGPYNVLLNRGVARALKSAAPDAILCGGYNYVASWQALAWARTHRTPFLLWSESNLQDMRRGHSLIEFLKDKFIRRSAGFVVPGQFARQYLQSRKVANELIFIAPNAVDNDLFATAAAEARRHDAEFRAQCDLPDRYILFVGRLVEEKGIFDLLSAYAKLDASLRRDVGLVFVGEGASRRQLQKHAESISPGIVKFPGFAQREQLGAYYALAKMMILPTYTDPWGLVVNEAMACGLPVIVSQAAGCAADLVKENWNGFLVPPGDIPALAAAIEHLLADRSECARMGANSLEQISHYSPVTWSSGVANAVTIGVTGD
jgi:glycosyltransferase involved in cell wall biosynthesis